ncbi:hypothetical protein PENSTE_c011G06295 [Penicillium steckii]|uniref:HTH psq-type domain-containing protein n=1 Tax=Penicillium steckii TaxID=303698 RepID=A0A1V6T6T0_9EURO|nr:hypothetical protein PENSTE_c011G06295 [Penicillium steckii]
MPKTPDFDENNVIRACEAVCAVEKPNLSVLAREFNVPYKRLRGRLQRGKGSRRGRKTSNMAEAHPQAKPAGGLSPLGRLVTARFIR